jgi:trans-2-enoyl-CoA reductase
VLSYLKSTEHKENVSKRFKGKKLSDEHKQKMSNSSKNKKPISIDNVIYESITSASIEIGLNRELIKSRLKSKKFANYFYINPMQNSKDF